MFDWFRKLFGRPAAAPDTDEIDGNEAVSSRESKLRKWLRVPFLRDPRIAEVLANLEELQEEHRRCEIRLAEDIARIAAGVEAMPQVRQQVEDFVRTVGGALGNAAARLEEADARMSDMEHSARTQTEIIAMMRTEHDRQGRSLRDIAEQSAALLSAMERFTASRTQVDAAMQQLARSGKSPLLTRDLVVYSAAVVALASAAFAIFR
ncbi:MAG: hypothetical protein EXS10_09700 [Phycisphaerales bacterium]|nr:hypothetical protein [Phycisphaerales bacterium]